MEKVTPHAGRPASPVVLLSRATLLGLVSSRRIWLKAGSALTSSGCPPAAITAIITGLEISLLSKTRPMRGRRPGTHHPPPTAATNRAMLTKTYVKQAALIGVKRYGER